MTFYSIRHLLIIFSFLVIPIIWALNLKKNYKILKFSLITLLIIEIIRVIFLIITNSFDINKDLSLQLCFTYPIIGIIYLLKPKNYVLSFLGAFGILYGTAAIIMTSPNPFLSFNVLECYIYHSLLVFIGTYVIKNYKPPFSFKPILIVYLQIIIGLLANIIIKNGANYIFLNSFLFPNYHLPYAVNIEVFNIPLLNGLSFNDVLISVINTLGMFWYIIFFIIIITFFSSFWLYLMTKKNKVKA